MANLRALPRLYQAWTTTDPSRDLHALIVGGAVVADAVAAETAFASLAHDFPTAPGALIVALGRLDGWRHPRLVVSSLRRDGWGGAKESAHLDDPILRDLAAAEALRPARDEDAPETPYVLLKDGTVYARFARVSKVRQAVAAAAPALAPVTFVSLRLGHAGPFDLLVSQVLVESLPASR